MGRVESLRTRVLVLFETRQGVLAYVAHFGGMGWFRRGRGEPFWGDVSDFCCWQTGVKLSNLKWNVVVVVGGSDVKSGW